MSATTHIAWTASTWTPVRARVRPDAPEIARRNGYTSLVSITSSMVGKVGPHCERISPGCANCYSAVANSLCRPNNGTGLPFDRRSLELVEILVDYDILREPLRWSTARKIFVCSQTDLFGDWVSDAMIDMVYAVMALCPQHTFQVLTKRPERLASYHATPDRTLRIASAMDAVEEKYNSMRLWTTTIDRWPLLNVWVGVSVEDQQRANERIPALLGVPAVVRYVSYEPALELVDFRPWLGGLDWVIVGGESGQDARAFDLAWARSMIEQCHGAGVAAFVKQAGSRPILRGHPVRLQDAKGGDLGELPDFLRVRQFPGLSIAGGGR